LLGHRAVKEMSVIQTASIMLPDKANSSSTKKARAYLEMIEPMFEGAGLSVASLDAQLRILEVSGSFFSQFGKTSADLAGRFFVDLLHPGAQERIREQLTRLADGERTRFVEPVVTGGRAEGCRFGELIGIATYDVADPLASIMVLVKTGETEQANRAAPHGRKILSEIDARILEGVAAGESTIRLASKLYLSRQGVEYHVGRLLRKLKVQNRASLVSRAYSLGILKVGSWPPRVFSECVK
jgi:PAS domain S-box-containing protein